MDEEVEEEEEVKEINFYVRLLGQKMRITESKHA